MIERRRRDFHLSACGGGLVLRDHGAQHRELDVAQRSLVVLAEVATFRDQALDTNVRFDEERVDPGEFVPDLEIAKIALREGTDCSTVGSRMIAASEELPISRRRLDHPRALRVEEVRQDEPLVVVGQLGRGLETQVQACLLYTSPSPRDS